MSGKHVNHITAMMTQKHGLISDIGKEVRMHLQTCVIYIIIELIVRG